MTENHGQVLGKYYDAAIKRNVLQNLFPFPDYYIPVTCAGCLIVTAQIKLNWLKKSYMSKVGQLAEMVWLRGAFVVDFEDAAFIDAHPKHHVILSGFGWTSFYSNKPLPI